MPSTTVRIKYTAKREKTGLSDVKISIWNSADTKVIGSAAMTELADGMYYYDYTPVSAGYHIWRADSPTQPQPKSETFLSDFTDTVTLTTGTSTLLNTQQLARYMNIEGVMPDRTQEITKGTARVRDNFSTGDGSTTGHFLLNSGILAGTYTITYGADEENLTALTEVTHYTIDKDLGKITLTSAGVTAVASNELWGEYSYVKTSHGVQLTDTQLQTALDMAENEVEARTYQKWTDSTLDTPNWIKVTDEKHDGQGQYNRDYFLKSFPIPDVSTTLSAAAATADTTLTVTSTNGFPSSGTITISSEKMKYTGKTTTTFTGVTRGVSDSSAVGHSTGTVYPWCFEISTTQSGAKPVYEVMLIDSEYDLDRDTGRVHVYRDDIVLEQFISASAPRNIPDRFRASYIYGNSTVPNDLKRVILMIASKDLIHTSFRRTGLDGITHEDQFTANIDDEYIKRTIDHYRNEKVENI